MDRSKYQLVVVRLRYISARKNHGVTLARTGVNKEALDCFTKSIELDSTHANSWRSKAVILKILGDKEGSEFCMKKFQILISNH